jgi:uncharacterized protein (TIGR03032 family)
MAAGSNEVVSQDAASTFEKDDAELRDPAEVVGLWQRAPDHVDDRLVHKTKGPWWRILSDLRITVLVTREYENLLVAVGVSPSGAPQVSFLRLPHPNGIAVDLERGRIHVGATRNPNQIFELGAAKTTRGDDVLMPISSQFLPGSTYLHDLAFVGGRLHGNAAARNTVVEIGDGHARDVWWPRVVEERGIPRTGRNYLQLNSIAAGDTLQKSFFTASTTRTDLRYRPGHPRFRVDRQGVVFDGASREVVASGLTRPHSARLYAERVWVDNSGYGELGWIEDGAFHPQMKLPGWTRGLGFAGDVAFVGTSRVLPRFRAYAPGVTVESCAVHAVDMKRGRLLASLEWPYGNQIFAVEPVPNSIAPALPFALKPSRSRQAKAQDSFYNYTREG